MTANRASWLLTAAMVLVAPNIVHAQSDTTQQVLGTFGGVQLVGKRSGYSLGSDCVLIGYRNQTTDKVQVDFTIWVRQRNGAEEKKKGAIDLKPGQFKGGGIFLGDDLDLDLCVFDSPITSWTVNNIKVTNLSAKERAEEAKRLEQERAEAARRQEEERRAAALREAEQQRIRAEEARRQEEERQAAAQREAEQQRVRAEEAQRQAAAEAARKAEENRRAEQERQRQRERDKATRAEQGKQIQESAADLAGMDVGKGPMRGSFDFGGGLAFFDGDTSLGDDSAAGVALSASLRQLVRLGSSMKFEIGARADYMFGSTAYLLYQNDLNQNTSVAGTAGTEGLQYYITQIQPTARLWFGSFGVGVLADWRSYSVTSEKTGDEITESQLAFAPVASLSSNQRSGFYMLSAFMVPASESSASLLGISGEITLGALRLTGAYIARSDGVNDISKDSQIIGGLGMRMPW